LLRLLGPCTSLLDLGCGQGVLARHLPSTIDYCGLDISKRLIQEAKKLKSGKFFVGDATGKIDIEKKDFDAAVFVLSLQNMENGKGAIRNAAAHLKPMGSLIIVLNHPCFRIPRQSEWGFDEQKKEQYRRVNRYMSELEIPIQTAPSQKEQSELTYSYHHPLTQYFNWLYEAKMGVEILEEWCSDKKSEGARAKMEDRARKEIPLFLALRARKEK
jgi:SAM-dependent methyltransferase